MNLAIFFEGTGQGVHGKVTNVSLLHDACDPHGQLLHLESGPGTHFGYYLRGSCAGRDWQKIFQSARRWFEANWGKVKNSGEGEERKSSALQLKTLQLQLKTPTKAKVFLFGFSRGALLARHFAAWLDKLGVEVAYMGLWDTVDATPGLEVSETCPANVRFARHAVAEHEARRFFAYVPLREGSKVEGAVGNADSLRGASRSATGERGDVLPDVVARGASDAPERRRDRQKIAAVGARSKCCCGVRAHVEELLFPGVHSDVGGLYEDNHELADAARAWIAQGAVACGLKLKDGVGLSDRVNPKTAVRHDSLRLVSNLWGLLKPLKRIFPQTMRRHE